MKSITGKVFEIRENKENLLMIQRSVGLGNIVHDINGVSLRIITDEPETNFAPVKTNISFEDVYLYYCEYKK